MTNRSDLLIFREFPAGDEPIDQETGMKVQGRIIRAYSKKTVGMRRREKNALVKWNGNNETEVRLGDNETARIVSAIHSWEGPGLTGREISIAGVDDLIYDDFIEEVFTDLNQRFMDKPNPKSQTAPALLNGTKPSGTTDSLEEPTPLTHGTRPLNLVTLPTGRLIKSIN